MQIPLGIDGPMIGYADPAIDQGSCQLPGTTTENRRTADGLIAHGGGQLRYRAQQRQQYRPRLILGQAWSLHANQRCQQPFRQFAHRQEAQSCGDAPSAGQGIAQPVAPAAFAQHHRDLHQGPLRSGGQRGDGGGQ